MLGLAAASIISYLVPWDSVAEAVTGQPVVKKVQKQQDNNSDKDKCKEKNADKNPNKPPCDEYRILA